MKFIIYSSLCILRIALTILPQTGYIHPDEYFQGSEVVYGDILRYKVYRPWEFTCLNPIRCIVFPYFVTGMSSVAVNFMKNTKLCQTEALTYLMVLLPRMVMCCISFLHDFYLYKMCIAMKLNSTVCLNLFASSYVTLVYFTRTLSNSLEALFFTYILYILTNFFCVHKLFTFNESSNLDLTNTLFNSFMLGISLSFGCFNRPTFICFAFFPCFMWIQFLCRMNRNLKFKMNVIMAKILGILCSSVSLTVIDTIYYNKAHYSSNLAHEMWKLVSTPLNFVIYNTNVDNLDTHGLHPKWLHMLINVPLLFSVYGILFVILGVIYLCKMLKNLQFNYLTFLVLSFMLPLIFLSLVPHQEPRFIIPLIIPMSLFYASSFITKFTTQRFVIWLWCITNILGLIFYGFLHQAGVYLSLSNMHTIVSNNAAIIYSKTYMPPRHLLAIAEKEKYINVFDFAGSNEERFELGIQKIMNDLKPQNMLFVMPYQKSLFSFTDFPVFSNSSYKFIDKKQLFPHISTENLPSFNEIRDKITSNNSVLNMVHSLLEMFSITVLIFKNL